MKKDFDDWNKQKKIVHGILATKHYKSREIWWCVLGVNIGTEQDGGGKTHERPVLILRGFGRNTCLVLPLTTSEKVHPMRICVGLIAGKSASVILSQIKVVDVRRLVEKICFLDKEIFENIRKSVRNLF